MTDEAGDLEDPLYEEMWDLWFKFDNAMLTHTMKFSEEDMQRILMRLGTIEGVRDGRPIPVFSVVSYLETKVQMGQAMKEIARLHDESGEGWFCIYHRCGVSKCPPGSHPPDEDEDEGE